MINESINHTNSLQSSPRVSSSPSSQPYLLRCFFCKSIFSFFIFLLSFLLTWQPSFFLLWIQNQTSPSCNSFKHQNMIPITLEMHKSQYSSWSKLFDIYWHAYQVIDHIIPSTPPAIALISSLPPLQPPKNNGPVLTQLYFSLHYAQSLMTFSK